ncbi:MAG: hypothetical protein WEE89_05155 [Gemmatimonadota bacterium]
MRIRLAAALALSAVTAFGTACSSAGRGGPGGSNPTLITQNDILRGTQDGVHDLYELIGRIRPRWLQSRMDRSLRLETLIVVYQNNSRLGGIEALRGYPLTNITSIRYLDAAQAGLLPGAAGGHIEGAIVISTVPRSGRGS